MSRKLGSPPICGHSRPDEQVEGLELGVVPALGLAARAAGGGVVVDRDQRLAVDETGAGVDVAQFVHRRDARRGRAGP